MRVLVVHAHPDPESFGAALNRAVVESLAAGGHDVDLCDLHAEDFQPILTRAERVGYHDLANNTTPVRTYVDRLRGAEGLVFVHPVWNYGPPAILKGWLDRVLLPGVSFGMVDGQVRGILTNIRKAAIVTTYGGTRWRAFAMGDPPRKYFTRVMPAITRNPRPVTYLAHYDMNRSTPETRAAFVSKVRDTMRRF